MSIFLSLLCATLYVSLHCHATEEQHSSRRSIPPPPPIPAPDPTTAAQGTTTDAAITDSTPLQVSKGQCSFGTNSSSSSPDNSYTSQGQLYADFGAPAPCVGVVTRWEVCFSVTEVASSTNLTFVVLRYDTDKGGYLIVNVHRISFESALDSGTICDYVDDPDSQVSMEEGDVMGFVNDDNMRVALAPLPEGMNSTLRVFDFSPTTNSRNGKADESSLRLNASIQREGFSGGDQHFAALVRIVLNTTTEATPPPNCSYEPTTSIEACSCSDGMNLEGTGSDVVSSTLFIIVTVVLGAAILILVAVIICMACCLCQRHCYKQTYFCRSQRRQRVTQRPGVEPLFEQSMQYNDLYVPSDQHKTSSKKRKSTNIQRNPAYITNQALEPEPAGEKNTLQDNNEYETTTFSKVADEPSPQPEVKADLEHTYEMIRSLKL